MILILVYSIDIPILPTVTAKITFQQFTFRNDIPPELFEVPPDYHEDPTRFPDLWCDSVAGCPRPGELDRHLDLKSLLRLFRSVLLSIAVLFYVRLLLLCQNLICFCCSMKEAVRRPLTVVWEKLPSAGLQADCWFYEKCFFARRVRTTSRRMCCFLT